MVYCFQAQLGFSTVAVRDDVLADMQQHVAPKKKWGVSLLEPTTTRAGDPGVAMEMRFEQRAEIDDIAARIDAAATGPRTPTAGSTYTLHDCTHDGNTQPCVVDVRRDW